MQHSNGLINEPVWSSVDGDDGTKVHLEDLHYCIEKRWWAAGKQSTVSSKKNEPVVLREAFSAVNPLLQHFRLPEEED